MKRKTTTEVVTKALARSGPELRPDQIRLADEAQPDKNKVYTQSDVNQNAGGGTGGGGGGPAPDLSGYATTEQLGEESHARENGDKANQAAIQQTDKAVQSIAADYTTTDEFNTLNGTVTQNKQDIKSLVVAFDTAVVAAQEGAENLEIELQSYAKKEDIPEGGGAVGGINEVLAEGNTAEALQSMRFRLGAESVPDPDSLNPDPILLEDGIGSAHRALASSWTSHVEGTGGLHSDVNCNYFANYVLDKDAAPTAMAKLSANLGLYLYQEYEGPGGRESYGISIDSNGIDVNNQFKVDLEGSVTAKEFIGDGSKLTNLPGGAAAPALPGQKWNLVTAHALPPAPGEMMWVEGDSALYCHATTADGIVLGNASTSFDQYDVNGTMVVSMYKHGVGIEAVFKAGIVQMITQGGQTFWKFLKMNSARFNLNEGTAYNMTASGLF